MSDPLNIHDFESSRAKASTRAHGSTSAAARATR